MKKRNIGVGLAAFVMMAGGAILTAPVASAGTVNLYDDLGYGGTLGVSAVRWSNSASTFNDRASSFTHSGTSTYYENINFVGRTLVVSNNCDDLRHHGYPVGVNQNWNDRISSFQ